MGSEYFLALAIVVVLLIVAAFVWYYNPGAWKKFSYKGGDAVAFTGGPTTSVERLRFRKCQFATQSPSKVSQSWDVSSVLNGMAVAYKGSNAGKTVLTLGGSARIPLNPFSFTKVGFNDKSVVPTKADSAAWSSVPDSATTLVGEYRVV